MVLVELDEEDLTVCASAITAYFGAKQLKYFPRTLALRNRLLNERSKLEVEE